MKWNGSERPSSTHAHKTFKPETGAMEGKIKFGQRIGKGQRSKVKALTTD